MERNLQNLIQDPSIIDRGRTQKTSARGEGELPANAEKGPGGDDELCGRPNYCSSKVQ